MTQDPAAHVDRTMTDDVGSLLDRFVADVRALVPLVAVWAHGSLALGDFQPGRSDFDLIALVGADISDEQGERLAYIHQKLILDVPLAEHLHCSYVVADEIADPDRRHLTWAGGRMFRRGVSPVSRRELSTGGLTLFGAPPDALVPAVTDVELAAFIRQDLEGFWYPATRHPGIWLRDIWVDLGMVTVARAAVTLEDGRLITKGQALDVLADRGAPARVLSDIRQRRYDIERPDVKRPIPGRWRIERANLARRYVRAGIVRMLAPGGRL
jgi:hypothetical protein